MNKAELIAKLADDAGITKTQANATLDSFVSAVNETIRTTGRTRNQALLLRVFTVMPPSHYQTLHPPPFHEKQAT